MNHAYRLVFNAGLDAWVPAPETAKGRRKGGRPKTAGAVLAAALALAPATPTWALDANALPSGGQVVAGSSGIATGGNAMTVNQTSQNLAIDWQSFNIGANAAVRFVQPNASAIALNRVIGGGKSEIFGKLDANGQVFLLNPNGVLFGKSAEVNVGGLVATTLSLSNADFMAGNFRFTGTAGEVSNQGSLNGDYVALLGGQVSNAGAITARLGTAALAAGSDIVLDFAGDGLIGVQVKQGALDALAENKGLIRGDGGLVLMTAQAADRLIGAAVNNDGVIEARTVDNKSGRILLLGDMDSGEVRQNGVLDASAPVSGDGGFIETSAAKVSVGDTAKVTTFAAHGRTGTWLIDPNDYTVAASGGDITGAALSSALGGSNVTIQSANGATSGNGDIFVNDTVSWSANTLTLTAERNIAINTAMNGSGTAGLALEYGQGAVAAGNTASYSVNAPVHLASTGSFSTRLGSDGAVKTYTILTSLGAEGSTTTADLQGMSSGLAGNYVLGADIDAAGTSTWNAGAGFAPIGGNGEDWNIKFIGTFDGLGHTITGLTINRPTASYLGLLGIVGTGGAVRNVGVVGGAVSGNRYVGGLVGWNPGGTISNAYATGNINGNDMFVGGLVGYNGSSGTISNAYATGLVSGHRFVGGLVGWNDRGSVSNAYATGNVSGDYYVGGLAGWNEGSVSNAYATGNVIGGVDAGGLVGKNNGTIAAGYWDTETTGQSAACGYNSGTCSATGLTTAQALVQSNYSDLNFTDTWFMVGGSTRPFLRSEYATTITNTHQLQLMAMDLTASYTLGREIDFGATFTDSSRADMWATSTSGGTITGAGFAPIGGNGEDWNIKFIGTFDGLGHTITGLTINRPTTINIGLFGNVGTGGAVRNVGLVNGSITGDWRTGGLVGFNVGAITSAYATGNINGDLYVGGLVGYNSRSGTISNAYATGLVSGSNGVGGLAGGNDGSVSNAYATGNVSGNYYVGGLVGWNWGTVSNAYATGNVNYWDTAGGLVGRNTGTIAAGYWDTETTGQGAACGYNSGTYSATGLTTEDMKKPFTFIGTGWNFATVWGKSRTGENGGYMVLRALSATEYDDYVRLSGNTSKTYGNANPSLAGITLDGVGTANASLAWGGAVTATTHAGSYAYSSANVLDVSTSSAGGVYVDYGSGALTIDPRALSLSGSRSYDGTADLAAALFTLGNLVGGEALTLTGAGTMADKNAGSGKTVTPGSLALGDGDGSGLAANYTLTGGTHAVDIAAAGISAITGITASGKTYDGGTAATLNTSGAGFTGLIGGDDLTITGGTGAFADKNVGTGKTVNITGLTLGGADAGNYTVSGMPPATSADITARTLSAGYTGVNRVYDGTTAATVIRSDDRVSGDALTLTETASFADKNVGTGKTVSVSGASLSGADAGNYVLASTTGSASADITARTLSAGYTGVNRVYDGTTAATVTRSDDRVSGDALTLTETASFADKNVGTGKTVSVSGASLSGADAGNYVLASTTGSASADITARAVSLSGSRSYDGTADLAAALFTLGNLVGGEALTLTGAGTMADKNAGSGKTVTPGSLALGDGAGGLAANYTLTGGTHGVDITTTTPPVIPAVSPRPDVMPPEMPPVAAGPSGFVPPVVNVLGGGIRLPKGVEQE